MIGDRLELPQTAFKERLVGWVKLTRRTWKKRLKAHLPHSINKPEFQQHRYPGVPLADFQKRIKRYQELLGDRSELKVAQISDHFFHIN
jgi:hypothetical protein